LCQNKFLENIPWILKSILSGDIVSELQIKKQLTMKKSILTLALVGASFIAAIAQTVWVGGEQMFPSKDIIDNAVNSKEHTTLVAAVKAAGLVETLKGKGPFTVFAPTNEAFGKLPSGTIDGLLKPESKGTLTSVLTYHVIPGKLDADAIAMAIKAGNGKAELKTVNGGKLWAMMNGPKNVILKDEKGNIANISTYDVYQSNGVIHVIDAVVMPK
jgi:uncharacterized surface protein with fasciclin (FAS1) repeats